MQSYVRDVAKSYIEFVVRPDLDDLNSDYVIMMPYKEHQYTCFNNSAIL